MILPSTDLSVCTRSALFFSFTAAPHRTVLDCIALRHET